jgi:hypothetical protein
MHLPQCRRAGSADHDATKKFRVTASPHIWMGISATEDRMPNLLRGEALLFANDIPKVGKITFTTDLNHALGFAAN